LQFARYLSWTTVGEAGLTVTDWDAPTVKESPRVSVGTEGAAWFAHPSAYTRVFPEATFEEKASPQEAALQFEVYLFCAIAGEDETATDDEAPRVNRSFNVSVGTPEGGALFAQLTPSTRMFPAVTLDVNDAAQLAALQLATYFFCAKEEA